MQPNSDILFGLNPQQKEAAAHANGPLLVLAGAGSGKTRVIAHRIARLVHVGVTPSRILAVTFTNKAAEEMRERVNSLLKKGRKPQDARYKLGAPFIGTFHALGVYILKFHGEHIGIKRNFTILDKEDAQKVMKAVVEELGLDTDMYEPARLAATVSRLKNELTDAARFNKSGLESPYEEIVGKAYAAYEARLQKTQSLDFDDLILKPVFLLQDHKKVREFWQKYWQYIHIDEYQDTNQSQYMLSLLLAQKHHNIAVVGDIDQAIYSWRGADWRNILNFERDFPGARVIALEENYRSTKTILEAAHNVIVNNSERKEVALKTKNPMGVPIEIRVLEDERKEAAMIARDIYQLLGEGYALYDIAILFRTNAQSRAIEEALISSAIPYKLIAGVRFYERKEIKDALAYFKYARNPDDALALKRIINAPPRGIGKVLMAKYISKKALSANERQKINHFETITTAIREGMSALPAHKLLKLLITKAGFKTYLSGTEIGRERLANIEELITVATKFKKLPPPKSTEAFLEEISLMSDQDLVETGAEKVHLLTAHAAKGLEFRAIIIAGMEEGLFPHALSQEEGRLEEERRLFYVALTRAKERVIITLTARRTLYGEMTFNDPSRFLKEIPQHLVNAKQLFKGEDTEKSVDYE